jgi:hypothetical protein
MWVRHLTLVLKEDSLCSKLYMPHLVWDIGAGAAEPDTYRDDHCNMQIFRGYRRKSKLRALHTGRPVLTCEGLARGPQASPQTMAQKFSWPTLILTHSCLRTL